MLRFVHPAHGRSVTRYRQVFDQHHGLEPPGAALLCVLLLRGPQTAAELQSRSGRLHEFGTAADAEAALHDLAHRDLVRLHAAHPFRLFDRSLDCFNRRVRIHNHTFAQPARLSLADSEDLEHAFIA
jgi:uncharacterized protein YceH (UPF0502 family)